MSTSQQRVARALAWWETLPAGLRPTRQDVEVAARLHVTRVPVMTRMLWEDQQALGRSFSDLAAVLTADDRSTAEAPGQPPTPSTAERAPAPTPAARPADESVAEDLTTWIRALRERGEEVPIDEELARKLRDVHTEDELHRITVNTRDRRRWRDFVREHGADLRSVLGLAPSDASPASVTSARSVRRTGATSPDGFTGGPDPEYTTSAPRRITFPPSETGGTRLSWEPPAENGQVQIFRVVARADTTPWDVDLGDKGRLVAATFDSHAVDDEPFTGAKRFYAVFLNAGPTEPAARASRPVLWAEGTAIQPVHGPQISTTGRRVSGRWTVSPGIDRVEILRVRVDDPPLPVDVYDPKDLISGSQTGENLDGFADEDVPSGRWEYRLYACIEDNGTTRRSPVVRSVQTVATELPVVRDLRVDIRNGDRFVISWSPLSDPELSVRIHKRLDPPPAGLADRTIDGEGLKRNGFTAATAITDPEKPAEDGGRVQVEWPWLRGEDRVYFNAITVTKGLDQYRVGQTVVRNRAGQVRHLRLVERVDEQFLTFAWPDGAGVVKVYQGISDFSADPSDLTALPELAEITPDMHAQFGGVHLGPLPTDGAVLHVVGLSFNDGRPTQGPPATVHYPGLIRIHYVRDSVTKQVRRGLRKVEQEAGRRVVVTANADVKVPVVLVLNRERLPLHPYDGERVSSDPVALQRGVPLTLPELVPGAVHGFVRLFVDEAEHQQEKYAVMDPPIEQLWWS